MAAGMLLVCFADTTDCDGLLLFNRLYLSLATGNDSFENN